VPARLSSFAPLKATRSSYISRRLHGDCISSTMECKQERRFGTTSQRQSQAAPDLSFGMSGLVALGFLTHGRTSNSSLALKTYISPVSAGLICWILQLYSLSVVILQTYRYMRYRKTKCNNRLDASSEKEQPRGIESLKLRLHTPRLHHVSHRTGLIPRSQSVSKQSTPTLVLM
jgi:hypothetical protein